MSKPAASEAAVHASEAILSAWQERNALAKQASSRDMKLALTKLADAAVVTGKGAPDLSSDCSISNIHSPKHSSKYFTALQHCCV